MKKIAVGVLALFGLPVAGYCRLSVPAGQPYIEDDQLEPTATLSAKPASHHLTVHDQAPESPASRGFFASRES
jgi:hypothetical protein